MKTTLALVFVTTVTVSSFAGEGHNHKGSTHEGHSMGTGMMHGKDGKNVTLSGELIGLTCFIKHGSKGAAHRSCAKSCAEKGLPIGLLSEGKIYQVSGKGHASLKNAYKPLLKYVERNVTVKGTLYEKNGTRMIVIERIRRS